MEPIHTIEYELTSELATDVQRALVRWDLRRGWWRDIPVFVCALAFGGLIVWAGLAGFVQPGVGGGLLCLVLLFVLGAVYRRWSRARVGSLMALLAMGTSDRRVRVEFGKERIRLETEFFRGEGTWAELDEAVIFPGFWLLRLTNGGQIVLPTAAVSPEVESFIRGRAQEVFAPIHEA